MTDTRDTTTDWETWHAAHERARADEHGFLAITGLYWLSPDKLAIPGTVGVWSTGAGGPVVQLGPGESLIVNGAEVSGRHEFGVLAERSGVTAIDGDVAVEIAKRDGHDIVRPRDPANPFLAVYSGTPTYAPTPEWVVRGRFVAFDEPRPVTVGSVVDELHHVYVAPGAIEFDVAGETHRLTAFEGKAPGSFLVLFTDETSGVTTYPANRSLSVGAPDADGQVTLDFTRAVNLPCAYTDFATCPLPPAENRLPFAAEAGEKSPLERVTA